MYAEIVMTKRSLNAVVIVVATLNAIAIAQFDMSWRTIDGGGPGAPGSSTGGAFSLSGTIGQPDAQAAIMTGGTFQLTGGFWPIVNVCPCLGDMNGDGTKDG